MAKLKMRFSVGDKVRIREFREEYRNQAPAFVVQMEQLCGEEFVIDREYIGHIIQYKGWAWHEDWLEFAEEEAEEDVDFAAFEAVLMGAVL